MADKPHYLGVAAIYRWEAENLREWVAFHRVVGVERFFLYDNASEDEHLEALAPFIDDGSVTVHPWPVFPGQGSAYDHALACHGHETRWIAFLDVDEFLFSPTGRTLPDVLADFEEFSAVEVSRIDFGPSGHKTKPSGPVIESYVRRRSYESAETDWEHVKSIVDPSRAERAFN